MNSGMIRFLVLRSWRTSTEDPRHKEIFHPCRKRTHNAKYVVLKKSIVW